jgi:DNA-directed RNA polymerase subunit RPC12/RpoP
LNDQHRQNCEGCGHLNGLAQFRLTPELKHYGRLDCPNCGRLWKWVPKPDTDSTKYRRPKKHKDLVERFSEGYCQLCLTARKDLPSNQVLEGHHVVPFEIGGSSEKENVWIVCTRCHRQIELIRTYNPNKCLQDGILQPNP